jgi:drug/metabolite transporter (DMT)-like permease
MAVLGEPVGTTLLAWLLLKQPPTVFEAVGGAVVCAGIYVAVSDLRASVEPAG